MKIGHSADKPHAAATGSTAAATPAPAEASAHAPRAAADASPASAASATVALSSTASTLLAGGTPAEFDAGKVDRITDAITRGTFKVDPEAIADKLIANAKELLSRVSA